MSSSDGQFELQTRVSALQKQISALEQQQALLLYTLSHDLRSPIMTILGFADMLLGDVQAISSSTNKQHLERIRSAAQRQVDLIEGLLKIAQLQRQALQIKPSDLSALAAVCLQDLIARFARSAPLVQINPTPVVDCDPQLMQLVLRELLSNALKFTRDAKDPLITFGAKPSQQDGWEFHVSDNGIGFDAARSTRLFEASQRLHVQQGFEGSGMGLVTVATVIRRHGGRIWAESQPGQGATFYFTLG